MKSSSSRHLSMGSPIPFKGWVKRVCKGVRTIQPLLPWWTNSTLLVDAGPDGWVCSGSWCMYSELSCCDYADNFCRPWLSKFILFVQSQWLMNRWLLQLWTSTLQNIVYRVCRLSVVMSRSMHFTMLMIPMCDLSLIPSYLTLIIERAQETKADHQMAWHANNNPWCRWSSYLIKVRFKGMTTHTGTGQGLIWWRWRYQA